MYKISDDTIYRLLKLLIGLVGRLPVGLADFCADLLGLIWFKLDRRHRQVTLENLAFSFGGTMRPTQIESLGKQVFKNIASMGFEVAWAYKLGKAQFLSQVTIKGLSHVKKAHADGRGVIVVSCHMGNFEMLLQAIDGTGLKGYAIYRALDFKPLDRLVRKLRQRYGVTMIPTKGALGKIYTVLSQGGVVGTMLDTNVSWHKGVFVEFFNRPACTNKGIAKLALKSGAPVVPMYTVRKNRKFLIEFLPQIPVVKTNDEIKDIEINTQNFSTAVESMVRKYPDQYFWVHNRWKTKHFCPWPRGE